MVEQVGLPLLRRVDRTFKLSVILLRLVRRS